MGLFFKKYAKKLYCPKCSYITKKEDRFVSEGQFNVLHTGFYCPQCNTDLAGFKTRLSYPNSASVPFGYYYILRGTNIKIPEDSKAVTWFIFIPSIIFGFIGLVPFFVFLVFGTVDSIRAFYKTFEQDFLRIYDSFSGGNSILY